MQRWEYREVIVAKHQMAFWKEDDGNLKNSALTPVNPGGWMKAAGQATGMTPAAPWIRSCRASSRSSV